MIFLVRVSIIVAIDFCSASSRSQSFKSVQALSSASISYSFLSEYALCAIETSVSCFCCQAVERATNALYVSCASFCLVQTFKSLCACNSLTISILLKSSYCNAKAVKSSSCFFSHNVCLRFNASICSLTRLLASSMPLTRYSSC